MLNNIRANLSAIITRLNAREKLKTIAQDMGYDNHLSFKATFYKVLNETNRQNELIRKTAKDIVLENEMEIMRRIFQSEKRKDIAKTYNLSPDAFCQAVKKYLAI